VAPALLIAESQSGDVIDVPKRTFMLDRVDAVIEGATQNGAPLQEAKWGDINRVVIAHPLARLLRSGDGSLCRPTLCRETSTCRVYKHQNSVPRSG
jgi:hypothetical protein